MMGKLGKYRTAKYKGLDELIVEAVGIRGAYGIQVPGRITLTCPDCGSARSVPQSYYAPNESVPGKAKTQYCRSCAQKRLTDIRRPPMPKTHCGRGHPFDEANTYLYQGVRRCRMCAKVRYRDRSYQATQRPGRRRNRAKITPASR